MPLKSPSCAQVIDQLPSRQVSKSRAENFGSMVALAALAASMLIVEIALTKFLSFKLFHHMTYALLSMVIMSCGAAGVLSYLSPRFCGLDTHGPWKGAGMMACVYTIALALLVPVFCLSPLSPYSNAHGELARQLALPIAFLMLSIPFLAGGICISQTLAYSKRAVGAIYCFDLVAAAIGAAACPLLLTAVGGYGTITCAAALGLAAAAAFWWCDGERPSRKQGVLFAAGAVAIALCSFYPAWAMNEFGADIVASKDDAPQTARTDFGGIAHTHWNAISRVDVSNTGTSSSGFFRYGLPTGTHKALIGRLILVDGGACTRQFRADSVRIHQDTLKKALWASPYVAASSAQSALVLGGGGGIDVLVAKANGVATVDVVEINPDTCRLLSGEIDDETGAYASALESTGDTKVSIINDEARHFVASGAGDKRYDVIQASGVDTLTAIQTGGMSLVENYLYTTDAVKDYMRLLKPDGVLSLTHWRTNKPGTSQRMYTTYLDCLKSAGVANPRQHVVVIADRVWTDSLLKKTPFTDAELNRIKTWAKSAGYELLDYSHINQEDFAYPLPVSDDKPYFYAMRATLPDAATEERFRRNDPLFLYMLRNSQHAPLSLIANCFLIGLLIIALPLVKSKARLTKSVIPFITYFATCGFAFLVYELAFIQSMHLIAGGPVYALSVVLVAVLAGYGAGSGISAKVSPASPKHFGIFAAVLAILFASLYVLFPQLTSSLMPMPLATRLVACGSIALLISAVIGASISSAMTLVRRRHENLVSWMWGVSCVFNALGSLCFIGIVLCFGIRGCLLTVGLMYFAANVLFALHLRKEKIQ